MFASLQKNALPLALVLLCAAAMYMVYRDMRRMEARMARLSAAVDSLNDTARDDADLFDMLDAVCPLPEPVVAPVAAASVTVVTEAADVPHAEDAGVPEAVEVVEGLDEDIEAEIHSAVVQALACA